MSGSSSTGTFTENSSASCDDLSFATQLASPQAAVLATLASGQVLQVALVTINATQVLVVQANGQTAGSLVGSNASRLRECILKGHRYKAKVTSVKGGQVSLTVEHV